MLVYAQNLCPTEQDFIIMGDLNADGSYFDEDSTSDLDSYHWLIDDTVDTTTKSTDYTYDRIILTDTTDLSGEYGVFRYDLIYTLPRNSQPMCQTIILYTPSSGMTGIRIKVEMV